eukprot:6186622-Pleurochrysis_carterae.AAC.4
MGALFFLKKRHKQRENPEKAAPAAVPAKSSATPTQSSATATASNSMPPAANTDREVKKSNSGRWSRHLSPNRISRKNSKLEGSDLQEETIVRQGEWLAPLHALVAAAGVVQSWWRGVEARQKAERMRSKESAAEQPVVKIADGNRNDSSS